MFFPKSGDNPMRVEAELAGGTGANPDERVFLDGVYLRDASYSRRKLRYFGAAKCQFEHCRFEETRIETASFGAGEHVSEYVDCSFDGLRFEHSIANVARFVRCSFRDVDLLRWTCFETEFIDCVFTGKLQTCIFNGTVPEEDRSWVGRKRNEFHGNDFSGAELRDVAFRTGIDLNQQRLPSGPDYLYVPDAAAAIQRAQRGLADWKPDSELHRLALVIVTVKANLVSDGQEQFLMNLAELRKGRRKFPPEVVAKVVSLFRGE
jgi:hypothetical protein